MLKFPIIGPILVKAAIARFARTLSTMFAAGVPLVEAMESVAGATGNIVYEEAMLRMKDEVATGQRLQRAMENTGLFPNMVVQMIAVGEESGSLDTMSGQGRGVLRGGSRQCRRQHVEPAGAPDHGDSRRAGRRHGDRDVPARSSSSVRSSDSRSSSGDGAMLIQPMLNDLAALYAASPVLFAGAVFVLGLHDRQLSQRRHLPAAHHAGARVARAGHSSYCRSADSAAPTTASAPSERFSLGTPRSACPTCKAPIKAWQNIPVISWLVLRGRCAACQAPISAALPAGGTRDRRDVRLGGLAFRLRRPPRRARCAVTWALIALTGIDIDHQLLPDSITLPLLWAGLLAAVVLGPRPRGAPCPCRRAMPSSAPPRAIRACGWCITRFAWSPARKAWATGTSSCSRPWAPGWGGNCCRW